MNQTTNTGQNTNKTKHNLMTQKLNQSRQSAEEGQNLDQWPDGGELSISSSFFLQLYCKGEWVLLEQRGRDASMGFLNRNPVILARGSRKRSTGRGGGGVEGAERIPEWRELEKEALLLCMNLHKSQAHSRSTNGSDRLKQPSTGFDNSTEV